MVIHEKLINTLIVHSNINKSAEKKTYYKLLGGGEKI